MIQAMLTLHLFKAPDVATIVKEAQTANKARGVQLIGNYLLAPVTTLGAGAAAANLPPSNGRRSSAVRRFTASSARFVTARTAAAPQARVAV